METKLSEPLFCLISLPCVLLQPTAAYAPINVKPLGGRPGKGGGFEVTSLPAVGTFDHLPSPGCRDF